MSKLITEITATLLLLFSMTIILSINNSVIFGQNESMAEQMSAAQNEVGGIPISSLTEWIGIFSIGIFVGLLAFNTNTLDNIRNLERKKIILSVAILSLSAGVIHVLLVQEHAKESVWWGVIFFISRIAQIVFGLIIVFIKNLKSITYCII